MAWVVFYKNMSSASCRLGTAVLAGLRGQAVFTGLDDWSTLRDISSFKHVQNSSLSCFGVPG